MTALVVEILAGVLVLAGAAVTVRAVRDPYAVRDQLGRGAVWLAVAGFAACWSVAVAAARILQAAGPHALDLASTADDLIAETDRLMDEEPEPESAMSTSLTTVVVDSTATVVRTEKVL